MIFDIAWLRVGLCFGLLGSLVAGQLPEASAQSDPAGFTTVINSPPSTIGNDGSIGSDTQLNVADGGSIGFRFEAAGGGATNAEVNVSGGSIGSFFDANSGSTVNISGGLIGTGFEAKPGSTVVLSGGRISERFTAEVGSSVTLIGAEFLVNGVPPAKPSAVTLSGTDVLTGTYQDGTTFVFSPQGRFSESETINGVVLQTVALPAIDLAPITISDPTDVAPNGLRAGQTLTVDGTGRIGGGFVATGATLSIEGGSTGSISAFGSTVDITDGNTGAINAFAGSQINISGGEVPSRCDAFDGSVVNISGGLVGNLFDAGAGSTVNISGGVFDGFFVAFSGSTINVSGGDLGSQFQARAGSTVVINGGRFGPNFTAATGSVTLVGGEFQVNGEAPLDPTSVTLTGTDVLTGTLEDGLPFIFSPVVRDAFSGFADVINGVTLLPATLPVVDLNPLVVSSPDDPVPSGLRAGQSLTLQGTGILPENFSAVGSTLTIDGGVIESGFEVADSTVNVTGGEFDAVLLSSTVNIEDGFVRYLSALAGTVVDQTGGTVGFTTLGEDSVFNLTGGTFGSGVSFLSSILAEAGSTLNLFVSEASIDGVAINLVTGDTLEIQQRNVMLSGLLSDGSQFSFLLQPIPFIPAIGGDAFAPGSTITVTLVPAVMLGDVNQDDVVNFEDIPSFIEALQAGIFLPEADVNQDGAVNFSDIPRFIEILTAG